jgi:hypothetical protein
VRNRNLRLFIVLLLSAGFIYSPILQAAQPSSSPAKSTAPEISHGMIPGTLEAGSSVQIKVTVSDKEGIKSVTLFYRTKGTKAYKRTAMYRIGDSDEYAVTLGKDDLVAPGVEYYIQALDLAGNTLEHGYANSPLALTVVPVAPKAQSNEIVTQKTVAGSVLDDEKAGKKKHRTWLWIGLGALAVGAIAAVASGGNNGGGTNSDRSGTSAGKPDTANVTVNAPVPGGP